MHILVRKKKKKSKFQGRKEGKERRKEVHSPYSDRCYLCLVSGVHWAPWKPFIRGENGFPRLYTWDSAPMVFAQQLGIQNHIMTQTQRIRPAPPLPAPPLSQTAPAYGANRLSTWLPSLLTGPALSCFQRQQGSQPWRLQSFPSQWAAGLGA